MELKSKMKLEFKQLVVDPKVINIFAVSLKNL
jgi:hypothetical protein